MIEIAKKVLKIEAEAVLALTGKLDGNFEKAVEIMFHSKGRVIVMGMGKSGLVGKKIAATLASTGTPALFLHPAEGIHGDLGMVTKGDVIIAISNSGETEEIVKLLPVFKRLAVPVIAMTGGKASTLSKASDVTIDVGVKEEACPMGLVPTASTTAALAMGDAVAVTLLDRRGFKEEDFACFHPGGSLGRRLLLRVEDVMHSGGAVPVVKETAAMREALLEITSKKLGLTTVVGEDGRLKGVITDGDLRRYLEKSSDLFDRTAGELASKDPKSIVRESLAAEALAVMERHSITGLVVVDRDGKPEGVLHLHDLLKAGIV